MYSNFNEFEMKTFLCILSLFFTALFYGQQNCDCSTALTNLVTKVENEYPGFAEKTKDRLLYDSVKENLGVKSKNLSSTPCLAILRQYISFFKDRHIWILPNGEEQASFSEPKKSDFNLTAFKRRIKNSKDSLEGIWKDENYTVGISKSGENLYTGFILESKNPNWKPKDVKFQLKGNENVTYYLSDHSPFEDTYHLHDGYLLYVNNLKSTFIKEDLNRKRDPATITKRINELDGFFFEKLTPKSSLIRISSFNYPYVERIEKLIKDNRAAIENSENLIIDIRNNGGGTDQAYTELLPLIATNPIKNVGIELLATEGLIEGVRTYKNGLVEKDAEKNREEINEMEKRIEIFTHNLGKFVNLEPTNFSVDSVQSASKSPKQIIVLANDKVASAGENFLLKAKQSKKVKVMGTPTSGVLDYANSYFFKFGCDNYRLLLPTYRSLRLPDYPIDNIGIQPDVYLDQSVTDWLQYAVEYLEN